MPPTFPGPAYRIVTARLVLRCWNPADAPLLKAAVDASREHLLPWMPWAASAPEDVQVQIDLIRSFRARFDANEDFVYGVFDPSETRLLGGTGLHTRIGKDGREIGYWIEKDFIGQGFATELSAALTRVAFEVDGMRRVEIHMAVENAASAAIPRKLGFTLEATRRQLIHLVDNRWHDLLIWTMLREEYPASPCAAAPLHAYDAAGRLILE